MWYGLPQPGSLIRHSYLPGYSGYSARQRLVLVHFPPPLSAPRFHPQPAGRPPIRLDCLTALFMTTAMGLNEPEVPSTADPTAADGLGDVGVVAEQ